MIGSIDYKWFGYAKNISNLSDFKKTSIGCIAIYKNSLISVGYNQQRTHPLQKEYNRYRFYSDSPPRLHAEINCLIKLKNNRRFSDIDFRKIKLYIYRCKKNGDIGNSRPCESCMHMIRDMGIREIYYTTDNGFAFENII